MPRHRNRSVLTFISVEEFAEAWNNTAPEHLPSFPIEDFLLGKGDGIKTPRYYLTSRKSGLKLCGYCCMYMWEVSKGIDHVCLFSEHPWLQCPTSNKRSKFYIVF